jgi:hypothetical protein
MEMKECSKCKRNKSLHDFYKRRSGLRIGEYYEKCKECYKSRGRSYYAQNREKQAKLALVRKQKYKAERRNFIQELKKDKPCADCRKIYPPWVMDFDHLEGVIKIGSISQLAVTNTSNFETIKKEITKCELVCANCHRQRTHARIAKQAEIANEVKAPL